MKLNIEKLKKIAATNIQNITSASKVTGEKFKNYLTSDKYEDDLDEAIANIYFFNPLVDKPRFDSANRKRRLAMKIKFLIKQSSVLIGAAGAVGAKVGSYTKTPQGVVTGSALGSSTGAVIVLLIAGGIVFRRFSDEKEVSGLVPF